MKTAIELKGKVTSNNSAYDVVRKYIDASEMPEKDIDDVYFALGWIKSALKLHVR